MSFVNNTAHNTAYQHPLKKKNVKPAITDLHHTECYVSNLLSFAGHGSVHFHFRRGRAGSAAAIEDAQLERRRGAEARLPAVQRVAVCGGNGPRLIG